MKLNIKTRLRRPETQENEGIKEGKTVATVVEWLIDYLQRAK